MVSCRFSHQSADTLTKKLLVFPAESHQRSSRKAPSGPNFPVIFPSLFHWGGHLLLRLYLPNDGSKPFASLVHHAPLGRRAENGGEIEPQQWQFEWGMMNHHLFEYLPAVFLHVKTELGMIHHQLFEFQRNPDGVCLLKWRVRESTRGAGRSNPTEVAPSKRLCTLCRCPLWKQPWPGNGSNIKTRWTTDFSRFLVSTIWGLVNKFVNHCSCNDPPSSRVFHNGT